MNIPYHFIQGKYCKDAKIFAENVEEEALRQVYENCDSPAFEGARIRLMPDCHAGAGCNVGFSVRLGRYANPNHIGVDIGCRMTCVELSSPIKPEDYKLVEHRIKTQIPFGFNVNDETLGKTEHKEFLKFLNTEYGKARSAWSDMIVWFSVKILKDFDYLNLDRFSPVRRHRHHDTAPEWARALEGSTTRPHIRLRSKDRSRLHSVT